MGGSAFCSRLLASLAGLIVTCAGVVTPAKAADGWRLRVSAALLAVYDSRSSADTTSAAAPPAGSAAATVPVTAPAAGADQVPALVTVSALTSAGATAKAGNAAAANARDTGFSPTSPHFDAFGRVQVDVHFDCTGPAPAADLSVVGLSISAEVQLGSLCVAEGWIEPTALAAISRVSAVNRVALPAYAAPIRPRPAAFGTPEIARRARLALQAQAAGPTVIDGSGVSIMRADQFVAQTLTNGTGVTVGVQSVGSSSLAVIQGRQELPAVQVFTPTGSSSPAGDEGTVLLQEVHAVAPGASLSFCGPRTFVDYTSCIQQMIAAGATILVDDLLFIDQDPMSSQSANTQALQQILTQNPGVMLFTAAGNDNGSYWEGNYAPVSPASPLTCSASGQVNTGSGQTDNYVAQFKGAAGQQLKVQSASFPLSLPLTFAWADSFNHNVSNFDVYWINNSNSNDAGCASSTGSTSTLLSPNVTFNSGSYTLYVATPDASLSGKFLKLWVGGDGLTSLSAPTPGSIVSPQAYAAGTITVGAVNGANWVGNAIEPFSSLGPISVKFPAPSQIQAPSLVAPDGIYVDATGTAFAAFLFPDGNFYGTSASVANAGAIAALLRGAFPGLTVPQVTTAMQSGATPLGNVVPNNTFGYGRADAIGALATIPAPTITPLPNISIDGGGSSAGQPFSVTGTGNLHFTVTSSNPNLIPPVIVAAGNAGVSVAPSTCGVTTLTCSFAVAPALGVGGTSRLVFSVVDGANRSAPATLSVTITNPAPAPAAVVNVTANPSAGGGGALKWWEVLCLALLAAASAAGRSAAAKGTNAHRHVQRQ